MPYILNEDEIKRRADIVQIIGRRVPLKPGRSSDHLEGSCPFHASKSGRSFHVFPEQQSWRCWGCQKGGSVAGFLMELEGCGYHEALEIMAQESGVIVEYDNSHRPAERKENAPKRQDVASAMDAACLH